MIINLCLLVFVLAALSQIVKMINPSLLLGVYNMVGMKQKQKATAHRRSGNSSVKRAAAAPPRTLQQTPQQKQPRKAAPACKQPRQVVLLIDSNIRFNINDSDAA